MVCVGKSIIGDASFNKVVEVDCVLYQNLVKENHSWLAWSWSSTAA